MEMLSKNAKVRLPFYVQETVKDVRRKCILINKRKLTHQLAVSGHSSDRILHTLYLIEMFRIRALHMVMTY